MTVVIYGKLSLHLKHTHTHIHTLVLKIHTHRQINTLIMRTANENRPARKSGPMSQQAGESSQWNSRWDDYPEIFAAQVTGMCCRLSAAALYQDNCRGNIKTHTHTR